MIDLPEDHPAYPKWQANRRRAAQQEQEAEAARLAAAASAQVAAEAHRKADVARKGKRDPASQRHAPDTPPDGD